MAGRWRKPLPTKRADDQPPMEAFLPKKKKQHVEDNDSKTTAPRGPIPENKVIDVDAEPEEPGAEPVAPPVPAPASTEAEPTQQPPASTSAPATATTKFSAVGLDWEDEDDEDDEEKVLCDETPLQRHCRLQGSRAIVFSTSNPKTGAGAARWAVYSEAKTVREFLLLGGTGTEFTYDMGLKRGSATTARITYVDRGPYVNPLQFEGSKIRIPTFLSGCQNMGGGREHQVPPEMIQYVSVDSTGAAVPVGAPRFVRLLRLAKASVLIE